MQQEFARFHREAGATFIYVTHDQAEAMALADRVAVMDEGRVEQVAPPRVLYREPATAMVARQNDSCSSPHEMPALPVLRRML